MANKEDIARFLHYISQLESSGGKNTDHDEVETGAYKGQTAQGQYGMLPTTMGELEGRFPSSFNEKSTPDDYAKALASRVLDRAKNDETVAAGMWRHGHNATPDKFDELRERPYAQEYEKLRSQIPYALDPNPYIQENKEKEEEAKRFPQLGKFFKKP